MCFDTSYCVSEYESFSKAFLTLWFWIEKNVSTAQQGVGTQESREYQCFVVDWNDSQAYAAPLPLFIYPETCLSIIRK